MDEKKHIINEPQPDYEKAEMDLLREALKKDHTGRFDMMTTLMKINLMLRNAKISHKPFKSDRR
jgi:hypothetical protein